MQYHCLNDFLDESVQQIKGSEQEKGSEKDRFLLLNESVANQYRRPGVDVQVLSPVYHQGELLPNHVAVYTRGTSKGTPQNISY